MMSAEPKCATVGVLNTDIPSLVFRERSTPVTSVITTNIKPVSAPADEPLRT